MQVFEHDDQAAPGRELSKHLGDRFEDPRAILQSIRWRSRPRRNLWKQSRQVQSSHRSEPPQHVSAEGGAQRFHPRGEGQDVFTFAATAKQNHRPAILRRRQQLTNETALADARFPGQEGKLRLTVMRGGPEIPQPLELDFSPDQWSGNLMPVEGLHTRDSRRGLGLSARTDRYAL